MDNKIRIITENGEENVEVLDIFQVEECPGKDYIIYTGNNELDDNHIEVMVSILEETEQGFNLLNIEDDKEWEDVQKAIEERDNELIEQ